MTAVREVNIHIGQVKVGRGDCILHSLLGSCVGIALLWPEKGVYGLAHCLLPQSRSTSFEISGRYVNQAVPSLLALMKVKRDKLEGIQAVVAGGSNITMPGESDPKKLIGTLNVESALKHLNIAGFHDVIKDTGGLQGRKISVNCADGSYHIATLPRIEEIHKRERNAS